VNVDENPEKLKEMLAYSDGKMQVPVIVEGERVAVGFAGDMALCYRVNLWSRVASRVLWRLTEQAQASKAIGDLLTQAARCLEDGLS
jgi:23S rRNA G2445 N2-methylase RlmL